MAEDFQVTPVEEAGHLEYLIAVVLAALFLCFSLLRTQLAAQFTVAIGYTTAVFLFVFFRWRGFPESYSLRDKRIRRQVPRLLVMHAAFVAFLFGALSVWEYMRQRLPSSWLLERGPRHDSYYNWTLILVYTVTWLTQVFLSRRVLKQSIAPEKPST